MPGGVEKRWQALCFHQNMAIPGAETIRCHAELSDMKNGYSLWTAGLPWAMVSTLVKEARWDLHRSISLVALPQNQTVMEHLLGHVYPKACA